MKHAIAVDVTVLARATRLTELVRSMVDSDVAPGQVSSAIVALYRNNRMAAAIPVLCRMRAEGLDAQKVGEAVSAVLRQLKLLGDDELEIGFAAEVQFTPRVPAAEAMREVEKLRDQFPARVAEFFDPRPAQVQFQLPGPVLLDFLRGVPAASEIVRSAVTLAVLDHLNHWVSTTPKPPSPQSLN